MAIQVIREVSADVIKRGSTKAVYAKQSDYNSRFLDIRIQEDGHDITVDSTSQVILNVERPDKLENMFYGTVNADGTVRVPLTSWMLELAGTLICDVSVISKDVSVAKLTTMVFNIYVEEAVIADGSFEETENYSLIIDLLDRTSAAEEQASKAAADAQYVKEQCEEATENAKNFTKIDPTLTQPGYSADAQSTGAAINALDTKVQGQLAVKSNKTHAHNAIDVHVVGDVLSQHDLYPGNVEAAIEETFLYFKGELAGKAPAGFGLGVIIPELVTKYVNDLNNLITNGRYKIVAGIANSPVTYGVVDVIARDEDDVRQIVYSRDNAKIPTFQRDKVYGTWGDWVDVSPSAFAPSGYGLGEKATTYYPTSEEELNTMLTECVGKMPDRSFGVFVFSDNIGSIWGGGTMHATVFKTENAYAVATFYGYDYPNNRQFIKNLYGENWQPISWVNPPMSLGVEYRTTERWNGNPVYIKLVDCGELPNNAQKQVVFANELTVGAIELNGRMLNPIDNTWNSMPYTNNVKLSTYVRSILIDVVGDYSGWYGYVSVKYTK